MKWKIQARKKYNTIYFSKHLCFHKQLHYSPLVTHSVIKMVKLGILVILCELTNCINREHYKTEINLFSTIILIRPSVLYPMEKYIYCYMLQSRGKNGVCIFSLGSICTSMTTCYKAFFPLRGIHNHFDYYFLFTAIQ